MSQLPITLVSNEQCGAHKMTCGCVAHLVSGIYYDVHFCAIHRAAQDLLAALTLLRGKMKSGWQDSTDISQTLGVVDQALTHADGRS